MTEIEAKEHLEARLECMNREMAVSYSERCNKNCDECDLLYAQGTIGEIKETLKLSIKAIEKQIAKKVFQPFGTHSFKCSNCWKFVAHEVDDNCDLSKMAEWCPYCGQKLDWGNEDAE